MPNQTITVQFTVQNEDDFFGTLEEGMISDQGGYSTYTVLGSTNDRLSSDSVLFLDQMEPPSREVMVAAKEIVDRIVINCEQKIQTLSQNGGVNSASHPWRLLYGEFLENEVHSESFNNLEEMLFEIEDSHTPYCVMEFVEGAGWECYQDSMGGEEIYYSSLFDQPE